MKLFKKYVIKILLILVLCTPFAHAVNNGDHNKQVVLYKKRKENRTTSKQGSTKLTNPVLTAVTGTVSLFGSTAVVLTPGILATLFTKYYWGSLNAGIIASAYLMPLYKTWYPTLGSMYYSSIGDKKKAAGFKKELSSAVESPLASAFTVGCGAFLYTLYDYKKSQQLEAVNTSATKEHGFPAFALISSVSFIALERLFDKLMHSEKYNEKNGINDGDWSFWGIIRAKS